MPRALQGVDMLVRSDPRRDRGPNIVTRRRAKFTVSVALLIAIVVVISTGFMATALGVSQFLPHRYASYVLMGLVVAHVFLYRRSLLGRARGHLGIVRLGGAQRGPPTHIAASTRAARGAAARLDRAAATLTGTALGKPGQRR